MPASSKATQRFIHFFRRSGQALVLKAGIRQAFAIAIHRAAPQPTW